MNKLIPVFIFGIAFGVITNLTMMLHGSNKRLADCRESEKQSTTRNGQPNQVSDSSAPGTNDQRAVQ